MAAWLPALGLALPILIGMAILGTRFRLAVGGILVLLAALAAFQSVREGQTPRTLVVRSATAAFEESEIRNKVFSRPPVSAPGWRWGAIGALFCGLWAAWAFLSRDRRSRPLGAPLALALGGVATVLALEAAAAPEALVGLLPLNLLGAVLNLDLVDTIPWLGSVVAGCLFGLTAPRKRDFFLGNLLFQYLVHLPLAAFATLATVGKWGTRLDLHTVDYIANVLIGRPVELAPGSTQQLTFLVWIPHLLTLPWMGFLSASGIGFAVMMFHRHPAPART